MTFTKEEMMGMLPVIISDLKHAPPQRRKPTNRNIREAMYLHVIREMYSDKRFLHNEPLNDGSTRVGMYIKGYVRDVWAYLDDAYKLIHSTNFERFIKSK